MSSGHFAFGRFVLDPERGTLSHGDRPVAIGTKALKLLEAFVRAPGRVLDKGQLMDAAWPGTAVEESNLTVQIAALRRLLGADEEGREWITTIPRAGYRFVGPVSGSGGPASAPPADLEPQARPSIAVLPFVDAGDGGAKEYLADGITEDIITALAQFRWFRVAARGSTFAYKGKAEDVRRIAAELGVRYVLQGSVRHAAPRLRISAQLVEAASGSHVWAERYDIELADAFAIQDEIAERVAGAIEPELLRTESLPAARRHTGNMTAWDLVRQGMWHFHRIERPGHIAARTLFRQACATDPDLPEAQIWLARVGAGIVAYGWSEDTDAEIGEAVAAGARAIALDQRDPYAHYGYAIASAYADAPDQAERAATKAIEIGASFALGHLVLGMARLFGGKAEAAIAPLERGLRLNPNDPQNFVWQNLLALAQLFAGHPERALAAVNQALAVRPGWPRTHETLACCLVALGRADAAHGSLQAYDGARDAVLGPLRRRNPAWAAMLDDMLRRVARPC